MFKLHKLLRLTKDENGPYFVVGSGWGHLESSIISNLGKKYQDVINEAVSNNFLIVRTERIGVYNDRLLESTHEGRRLLNPFAYVEYKLSLYPKLFSFFSGILVGAIITVISFLLR